MDSRLRGKRFARGSVRHWYAGVKGRATGKVGAEVYTDEATMYQELVT